MGLHHMQGVHEYFNQIRQWVDNQTHRFQPIFCTLQPGHLCCFIRRQETIDPNDLPLDFNGASVQMAVQGKRFATGVNDVGGKVPRFGEAIIDVPVTFSVFGIVRQAFDVMTHPYRGKLADVMTGRLAGPAFNSMRFTSKGEFTLPAEIFERFK
jgi:hypothetical protein